MSQQPDASIADELRALGWLWPYDVLTRDRILAMLSGSVPRGRGDVPAAKQAGSPGAERPVDVSAIVVSPPEKPVAPPADKPDDKPLRPPQPLVDGPSQSLTDVTTVRRIERRVMQWLPAPAPSPAGARPLAQPFPLSPSPPPLSMRPPPSAPILSPRQTRAVLTLLAATLGEVEAPDLSRLIARIACGHPVTIVPRQHALTVRRGVQLLIDWGVSMAPFATDREQVRQGLVCVLGQDRVETLGFDSSPLRKSGAGGRREWKPGWKAPARGVPVVVISNVGLEASLFDDNGSSPAEWARFAALARANDSTVIMLSPYGPDRWPGELAHSFVWVPWSETLSAARLNRIRRDAASRMR